MWANLQLADLSAGDIAGMPLHCDTQMTVCMEEHMVGIPTELHQGIGPFGPSGGKLD